MRIFRYKKFSEYDGKLCPTTLKELQELPCFVELNEENAMEKKITKGLTLFYRPEMNQYTLHIVSEDGSHSTIYLDDEEMPVKHVEANYKWAAEVMGKTT